MQSSQVYSNYLDIALDELELLREENDKLKKVLKNVKKLIEEERVRSEKVAVRDVH